MDVKSSYLWAQVCIVVCFVFAFSAPQFSSRKYIFIFQAVASIFMGVHFLLLGSVYGFLLWLLSSIRFLITIKYSKSRTLFYAFFALVILSSIFTTEGVFLSLLILCAWLATVVWCFVQWDEPMRRYLIMSSLIWLIYSAQIESIGWIVFYVFYSLSSLVGYKKHALGTTD